MFGEGFPFDLVLIALTAGILYGVNKAKLERAKMAEDEWLQRRKHERLNDHQNP